MDFSIDFPPFNCLDFEKIYPKVASAVAYREYLIKMSKKYEKTPRNGNHGSILWWRWTRRESQ